MKDTIPWTKATESKLKWWDYIILKSFCMTKGKNLCTTKLKVSELSGKKYLFSINQIVYWYSRYTNYLQISEKNLKAPSNNGESKPTHTPQWKTKIGQCIHEKNTHHHLPLGKPSQQSDIILYKKEWRISKILCWWGCV